MFKDWMPLKISNTFVLRTPQRQNTENTDFLKFLSFLRVNDFDSENGFVVKYIHDQKYLDSDVPDNALRLYDSNVEVDRYYKDRVAVWLEKALHIKEGVSVLLTEDLDVEQGWIEEDTASIQRLKDRQVRIIHHVTREIHPTTHKVQSLTVDIGIAISLLRPMKFNGQLYVACSRVRWGNQLYFTSTQLLNRMICGFDQNIVDFFRQLRDEDKDKTKSTEDEDEIFFQLKRKVNSHT
ncbi:uncharacterized protein BX663DRAFT_488563 [Cokeromyces recurvatus]|uniref:uncharacterized protein n=1 Tax=Cokeromyces recurvatus TaxID=90255 RepID=UPI00221EBCDE|nr:uncharacterized protein BX663DRAFT_488563 [Cokeromyces recurvatus]KAI7900367.1 hypothetical protein BX663DRAFT_488563 [Cokeromyces recurvatus]